MCNMNATHPVRTAVVPKPSQASVTEAKGLLPEDAEKAAAAIKTTARKMPEFSHVGGWNLMSGPTGSQPGITLRVPKGGDPDAALAKLVKLEPAMAHAIETGREPFWAGALNISLKVPVRAPSIQSSDPSERLEAARESLWYQISSDLNVVSVGKTGTGLSVTYTSGESVPGYVQNAIDGMVAKGFDVAVSKSEPPAKPARGSVSHAMQPLNWLFGKLEKLPLIGALIR